MRREKYIPTPQEVGHEICGRLMFGYNEGMSLSLHALLRIIGVSISDVGKMTGLTSQRIRQFAIECQAVPSHRAVQFHYILRSMIESFEENLTALKKDPKSFKAALVKEAVPAAQAIMTVCKDIIEADKKALSL